MDEPTQSDRRAAHDLIYRKLAPLGITVRLNDLTPQLVGKTEALTPDLLAECKRLKEAIVECVLWFAPKKPKDAGFEEKYAKWREIMKQSNPATLFPENQNGQDQTTQPTQEADETGIPSGHGTPGDPED